MYIIDPHYYKNPSLRRSREKKTAFHHFVPTLHEAELKTDDAEVPVVLLRCELWVGPDQVEMRQRVIVRCQRCPSGHLHNLYRVPSLSVGHVDEESEGRIWSQRIGRVHGELCNVIFPHLCSVFSQCVQVWIGPIGLESRY